MAYILIEQKIIDWPDFERLFKGDSNRRRIIGSKGARVIRDPKDPDTALIVFEWEGLEAAQKFVAEWEATVPWSRSRVGEELFEVDA
jgi:heme-degrading monooxygenase HmoA